MVVGVTVLSSTFPGCIGQSCADVGCVDGLTLDGAVAPEDFLAEHVFELQTGDLLTRCTVKPTSTTVSAYAWCEGGGSVSLGPERKQIEQPNGATSEIVPGSFRWTVSLVQLRTFVDVRHFIDGQLVLDETIEPTFTRYEVNGPGCGPVCFGASHRFD